MRTKMKTKSAATKRYRVTGSGKIKYRQANRAHLLTHKSAKRKRQNRRDAYMAKGDSRVAQRLVGVSS